jgi:hypothetical protein
VIRCQQVPTLDLLKSERPDFRGLTAALAIGLIR